MENERFMPVEDAREVLWRRREQMARSGCGVSRVLEALSEHVCEHG